MSVCCLTEDGKITGIPVKNDRNERKNENILYIYIYICILYIYIYKTYINFKSWFDWYMFYEWPNQSKKTW